VRCAIATKSTFVWLLTKRPERHAVLRRAENHLRAIAGEIAARVGFGEIHRVATRRVEREARRHAAAARIEIAFVENFEPARRQRRARRHLELLQLALRIADEPAADVHARAAHVLQLDRVFERQSVCVSTSLITTFCSGR
jgi:hypothetical protein